MEEYAILGDSPGQSEAIYVKRVLIESCSLRLERKVGDKSHLKLNIGGVPIAQKYREGKMKRTLERELKVPEIAEREVEEMSYPVE